jgi:hypothetical protein
MAGSDPDTHKREYAVKLAYLTEIAALLASHSRLFVENAEQLSTQAAGDYYILSRNRFNRWMRDLKDIEAGVPVNDPMHLMGLGCDQTAARSIVEQILINEMLVRIWTVMVIAQDRFQKQDRIRPLVHNVFLGQLAVRRQALSVCLNDHHMTANDVVEIDKLRESTERWTDLLNCALMGSHDLWQYAFDESRAKQFLQDRHEQQSLHHRSKAWVLILSGLRFSFPDRGGLSAALHSDDRRIVRLMLTSFPENSSESTFWMMSQIQQARIS